ncbi:MAG: DUF4338 domain-containing protein [Desulfovibrio sp.]|nr:DUF4338 domain-containing protein [Desulfovibrio sp.]
MSLLSYDHISTILSQPASLEWIRQTLAATPRLELDTLSVVVCLHFGFSDEHGQLGLRPCAEVLRDLGRQGLFRKPDPPDGTSSGAEGDMAAPALPDTEPDEEQGKRPGKEQAKELDREPAKEPAKRQGKVLGKRPGRPLPQIYSYADFAGLLKHMLLVQVKTAEQRADWDLHMAKAHASGTGASSQHRVRYLVYFKGLLAALGGFSAALACSKRCDEWIGWSAEKRDWLLAKDALVRMDPFLVCRTSENSPPEVYAAALDAMCRAVQEDWKAICGAEPFLAEIDVLEDSSEDLCCRRLGLTDIGTVKQEPGGGTAGAGTKKGYMRPLVPSFREGMDLAAREGMHPVKPAPAKAAPSGAPPARVKAAPSKSRTRLLENAWGSREFALPASTVQAKDRMELSRDLAACAQSLALAPVPSASAAFHAGGSSLQAWHRLLEDGTVTPEAILSRHAVRTLQRAKEAGTVLFLPIGLEVSLQGKPGLKSLPSGMQNGLGPGIPGMHVFATLAAAPKANGLLGVVKASLWTGGSKDDMLSQHCRDIAQAARSMPYTQTLLLCGRQACDATFLDACQQLGPCGLVVRARDDISLAWKAGALGDLMAQAAPCGKMLVASGLLAGSCPEGMNDKDRPARYVKTILAIRRVLISPPADKPEAAPFSLVCIAVQEKVGRGSRKPLRLLLLTTLPVENASDAERLVRQYAKATIVEPWLSHFQQACDLLEHRTFRLAPSLSNALAVFTVVAWRKAVALGGLQRQDHDPSQALPSPQPSGTAEAAGAADEPEGAAAGLPEKADAIEESEHPHSLRSTLLRPASLAWLRQALAAHAGLGFDRFCELACGHFGFRTKAGKLRTTGLRLALAKLDSEGRICLQDLLGPRPAGEAGTAEAARNERRDAGTAGTAGTAGIAGKPKDTGKPTDARAGLLEASRPSRKLAIVKVETQEQMQIWEEAMPKDGRSPIGTTQLRYLAYADGKLAIAVGFCQARLSVCDRDAWLAWSGEERRNCLNGAVVWMYSLRLPEGAHGPGDTASAALGAVLGAVREDWRKAKGSEPLLAEAHAEPGSPEDAFFRDACWITAGTTALRLKNAQGLLRPAGSRTVYLHPFAPGFWESLERRLAPYRTPPSWAAAPPLAPSEGLEKDAWARSEFGDAKLGLSGKDDILAECAGRLFASPSMSAEEAFGANLAVKRTWFRLADNRKVTPEGLLSCHRERTLRRAKALKTVLFVQTGLNVSLQGRPEPDLRGVLPRLHSDLGPGIPGMHAQACAAVNPASGQLLGIIEASFWAGQGEAEMQREHCLRIDQTARDMPGTLAVSVCDPSADETSLIDACRELRHSRLVFRASAGLVLPGAAESLGALMAKAAPCGTMRLAPELLAGLTAEPGQDAGAGQNLPQAPWNVDLAVRHFSLPPPADRPDLGQTRLVCVAVRERGMPGERGREALLLSTLAVERAGDAQRVVEHYAERRSTGPWLGLIRQVVHALEADALRTPWRLRNILTVSMVVAWMKTLAAPPDGMSPGPRRQAPARRVLMRLPRPRKPRQSG